MADRYDDFRLPSFKSLEDYIRFTESGHDGNLYRVTSCKNNIYMESLVLAENEVRCRELMSLIKLEYEFVSCSLNTGFKPGIPFWTTMNYNLPDDMWFNSVYVREHGISKTDIKMLLDDGELFTYAFPTSVLTEDDDYVLKAPWPFVSDDKLQKHYDDALYVPGLQTHQLYEAMNTGLSGNAEEACRKAEQEALSCCYTLKDFLDCGLWNVRLAYAVYTNSTWQNPDLQDVLSAFSFNGKTVDDKSFKQVFGESLEEMEQRVKSYGDDPENFKPVFNDIADYRSVGDIETNGAENTDKEEDTAPIRRHKSR